MGKKFLSPFFKLLASFSAAVLLSVPGTSEADSNQPTDQSSTLEIQHPLEINDFVLERSGNPDSSILAGHGSHRSHGSHGSHGSHSSHSSHYSSRW